MRSLFYLFVLLITFSAAYLLLQLIFHGHVKVY